MTLLNKEKEKVNRSRNIKEQKQLTKEVPFFNDNYEIEQDIFFNEVKIKAENLRKKKRKKAVILSVMRVSSTLMLFLSFAFLQSNFSLYLFSLVVGCLALGLSTFLEKGM